MEKRGTFWEHLEELRRRIIYVASTLGVIFIFCIMFGFRTADVNGITIVYPYPDIFNNTASLILKKMVSDLVPSYVQITMLSPADAFLAEINVSLFMTVILGMPTIVYHLNGFLAPGLRPHEKRLIFMITVPASLLFIFGCMFAYFLITPFTLDFLYSYGVALDLNTFLTIDDFITFVLLFIGAFGLAFELPIIMVGLTSLGVVNHSFWKENWRYAVVGIFIFGAVITPDGSGITMILVALPLLVLYLGGYLVSIRVGKKREGLTEPPKKDI
jgi:sec-independent protein translocase protein TatC